MRTQISPMLAVGDANAAIEFYQAAFGATRSPASAGFTTVRIELFVDDPVAVYQRAVAESFVACREIHRVAPPLACATYSAHC